jgi:hypothetical protein
MEVLKDLIADLVFRVCRHHSPWFSDSLLELFKGELASGEIRAIGALAFHAVAMTAASVVKVFPPGLARLRVALCKGNVRIEDGENEKK